MGRQLLAPASLVVAAPSLAVLWWRSVDVVCRQEVTVQPAPISYVPVFDWRLRALWAVASWIGSLLAAVASSCGVVVRALWTRLESRSVRGPCSSSVASSVPRRRRRMAVPPLPVGALGPEEGRFALLYRDASGDADEFLLGAEVTGHNLWAALTTEDAEPHNFCYVLVEARAGNFDAGGLAVQASLQADRPDPFGGRFEINRICEQVAFTPWAPTPADVTAVVANCRVLAANVRRLIEARVDGRPVAYPVPVVKAAGVGAAGGGGGMPLAAAGGPAVPPLPPLVARPDVPEPGRREEAHPTDRELIAQIRDMRSVIEGLNLSSTAAKKKKKKDKRKRSDSSDSAADSSSSAGSQKYVRLDGSRKEKITDAQLRKMNLLRFKRRSDLLNFNMKHPGALAADFLMQVRQLVSGSAAKDTKELAQTDPALWVGQSNAFKDARDSKEAMFLSKLLVEMGRSNISLAADLVAQRFRELRLAKRDGMTWDKASAISLMPSVQTTAAQIPEGAFSLHA
eukprot:TRINITY_DN34998_c0_g1_i4.p1 TRINITY_DN34998_c0_g1~~TRINITY_DN34998_c0_g1_i4.p1  ORF type:complete len:512 (+),score=110.49 TRINITY_DN34998_c0_g1_i4:32-1567(+)